ncbi:MAG: hypothetical protein WC050_01600 [Candidatus Paceibacterota bacterium]
MKKFVVIYRVPVETMEEWKKNTSQEEMMKQGKELGEKMTAWTKKHEKALIDKGFAAWKEYARYKGRCQGRDQRPQLHVHR